MIYSTREILLALSYKYCGDFNHILEAIHLKEFVPPELIEEAKEACGNQYVTYLDSEYPEHIKQSIVRPPIVLFYRGDLKLFSQINLSETIGVIGSRHCTKYGVKMTKKIVSGLPKNTVIISGLAKGIDRIAHQTALDCNLKTIAVLGCGVDYIYPNENCDIYKRIINDGGLILSEYPGLTPPSPEYFGIRNRIVAGLSGYVLVTEAYERSGTSITINFALQTGKCVGVVPYPAGYASMCNELIKDGAEVIESAEDLIYAANLKEE